MQQTSYDYCKQVKEMVNDEQSILIKGFRNYFGKEYENCFRKRLNQINFHLVDNIPSVDEYYNLEAINIKMKTILSILTSISFVKPENIPRKINEFDEWCHHNALFATIFGKDFQKRFSYEEYLKTPICKFDSLNIQEQLQFVSLLGPFVRLDLRALQQLSMILKKSPSILEDFQQYEKITPRMKSDSHKKLNVVSFAKGRNAKELPIKIIEDHFQNNKLCAGFRADINQETHVVLPMHSSLNVIFHEVGHVFLNHELFFQTKFLEINQFRLNGIFLNSGLAMEAFHDYYILQCLRSVSSYKLKTWKSEVEKPSQYRLLFPLVQMFLGSFEYLMQYAMINNLPNLVNEVVGKENFQQFLELFYLKDGKLTDEQKRKARELIEKMEEHAKCFQVHYYQSVQDEIKALQKSGKKVRILKPNMEKLEQEERIIRATINELS